MIDASHKWNTSFKPLVWGGILSIILVLLAYFIVVGHGLSGGALLFTILVISIVQALVQFICFLQIFVETKPRWSLMLFLFMAFMIFALVAGSIWIMYNIDYNVMLPGQGLNSRY